MKHVLACLLLLLVVTACSDGDSMRRQLQELQARNQVDSLMTDLNQATTLCDYFDRHGTPNERMLAHYLLGRTHADLGEAPEALQAFHDAADCADTTASDCDYRQLARVQIQIAELFLTQNLPYEMLEHQRQAYSSAQKGNDTLMWIGTKEWTHIAYNLIGDSTKALASTIQAYNEYLKYGYPQQAANCASAVAAYLIDAGRFDEAKYYIEVFETQSPLFVDDELKRGASIYNYYKGMYYLGINKPDSAVFFLYKDLHDATTPNDVESAYKGLYRLYQHIGMSDSAAKYADLCYRTSEESYRFNEIDNLRNMQALYNYSRQQEVARQKTEEASRHKQNFYITLFTGLMLASVFVFILFYLRRRKKEQINRLYLEYQHHISILQKAKDDLVRLKQSEYEDLHKQKEKEVAESQQAVAELRARLSLPCELEMALVNTDIYKRLRYLVSHPKEKPVKSDWLDLQNMISQHLPEFSSCLNANTHITDEEYLLCILIRLHFAPSDICLLMDMKPQTVSMKRQRLLKKIFDRTGKASDFDDIIRRL